MKEEAPADQLGRLEQPARPDDRGAAHGSKRRGTVHPSAGLRRREALSQRDPRLQPEPGHIRVSCRPTSAGRRRRSRSSRSSPSSGETTRSSRPSRSRSSTASTPGRRRCRCDSASRSTNCRQDATTARSACSNRTDGRSPSGRRRSPSCRSPRSFNADINRHPHGQRR